MPLSMMRTTTCGRFSPFCRRRWFSVITLMTPLPLGRVGGVEEQIEQDLLNLVVVGEHQAEIGRERRLDA